MLGLPKRALAALSLVVATAAAAFIIGRDASVAIVVLVGGAAAVLVVVLAEIAPLRSGDADEAVLAGEVQAREAALIRALSEPLMIVAGTRVEQANGAARALLGEHVVGEDVRLAIRHPAAGARLMHQGDEEQAEPIHLVGLGTRDQRWAMRVHALGDGRRVVHLTDSTGSYAAERIRVDFVANASHELRTPLASLLGFIETLGDEAGDDPDVRKRFLTVMFDEARRMQRLIDDLMSLSRIEAEKYRAPEERVDLGVLIAEVRAELSATPDVRGHDLVTALANHAPTVLGDRAQLSQLLHNVAGNAMKYGRPGTPVTIALAPAPGNMVRLSVTDEGDGIAPEHLPRLTERFYRVDSGRSRAIGGTGLGLSLVKHIVERHRGRLDISSEVGRGTTITVLLPASVSSTGNETATVEA